MADHPTWLRQDVYFLHRAVCTRGRERSIPIHLLVDDVKRLVDEGFKEVVLLGQTVNSYDDGTHNFGDLLFAMSEVEGIERIRFTSPHPSDCHRCS